MSDMRAGRALLGALAVCAVCTGAVAQAAASTAAPEPLPSCQVGGAAPAPTKTPETLLACGEGDHIPFEVVGTNTSEGFCTGLTTSGRTMSVTARGLCKTPGLSWAKVIGGEISLDGIGWVHDGRGSVHSNLSGELAADVTEVQIRVRRKGHLRVTSAAVGQVSGELLASLGQTEPFGVYGAVLPGCIEPRRVRVVALDAEGRIVGARRGRYAIKHFCRSSISLPPRHR